MVSIIPSTSSTSTSSSTASNGVIVLSNGTTQTYSGGSEILVHTIKFWFAKLLHYRIENTGSDAITIRITGKIKDTEFDIVPAQTLQPGDSARLRYRYPLLEFRVYVTPTSSSSSWHDEYILRW